MTAPSENIKETGQKISDDRPRKAKPWALPHKSVKPVFDELIHAPNRLRICAALSGVKEMEFVVLQEIVEVSPSVLSKQLKALADAGYVEIDKRLAKRGYPSTWVAFTEKGLEAFNGHIAALKELTSVQK
ncbi:MAG: transcriptional regulator [Actinomycetaceae bacterium]|nr:transcriptional regulator [Actinomycetaceae bacterium]